MIRLPPDQPCSLVFAGTHRKPDAVRPHAHPCMELILVIEGECTVDCPDRRLRTRPGDLLMMPARVMHNQISDGLIYTVYVGFTPSLAGADEPTVLRLGRPEFLQQCMLTLAQVHLHAIDATPAATNALTLSVLREVVQRQVSSGRSRSLPSRLLAATRFIEQNLDQPLGVGDIARGAHTSASNLHLLFRAHMDTTPLRFLLSLRMRAARKHLLDPYLTVKEVASRCGYSDVNLFVRTFKKVHGLPPGRWREQESVQALPTF